MSSDNIINISNKGKGLKWIPAVVILIIVAILAAMSITIVPPGHTGVRVRAGRVVGTAEEGLNFRIPLVEQIQRMSNRTVAMEMTTEAVTRDLQAVRMVYLVNYRLNVDSTANVFQTIGIGFESVVLRPRVEETIKDITARYSIDQLITERARVSTDITMALQEAFTGRGFTLEAFNIVDFQFSEEFSNAIEQVRIAEQRALQAEQELSRAEFEAEADRVMARAQADVLRYQAQELTESNLAAMWIEKWNGILPTVMTGDGGGMFLNLNMDDLDNIHAPTPLPAPVPEAPPVVEEPTEPEEPVADAEDDDED